MPTNYAPNWRICNCDKNLLTVHPACGNAYNSVKYETYSQCLPYIVHSRMCIFVLIRIDKKESLTRMLARVRSTPHIVSSLIRPINLNGKLYALRLFNIIYSKLAKPASWEYGHAKCCGFKNKNHLAHSIVVDRYLKFFRKQNGLHWNEHLGEPTKPYYTKPFYSFYLNKNTRLHPVISCLGVLTYEHPR